MREAATYLVLAILGLLVLCTNCARGKGMQYVTCGSTLKLMNREFDVRLHSHDIKYGSGSGQQSVTGINTKEDKNSHWLVKAESKKQCVRGTPVKCGDVIRLEHVETKKNLHSHHMSSPLTGKQEVSAYGNSKGEGDSGDNWLIVCHTDYWKRDEPVMLNHVDTDVYLAVSGGTYGSPIAGQVEVVGDTHNGPRAQWVTMEGVFIHPNNFKTPSHPHTEL